MGFVRGDSGRWRCRFWETVKAALHTGVRVRYGYIPALQQGNQVPLLQARGKTVQSTHARMHGRRNGEHYEFDILAGNGEEIVVVEVKTTLRAEDVAHFLGKLGKFTEYEPVYKGKKVYGAVAYLKADASVQVHAQRQGLYVIRATGSSASIINSEDFRPRVFG